MVNLQYPFEVRPLTKEEGGGWLVTFPDLPGCMTDGETIEEALHNAEDAIKSWIETSKELNLPIPDKEENGEAKGRFLQRVPKTLHAKLIRKAKAEGVSVNTLVISLISEGLGAASNR